MVHRPAWSIAFALACSSAALAQPEPVAPGRPLAVAVTSDLAASDTLHVDWIAPDACWWDGTTGADIEALKAWLEESGIAPDANGIYAWGGPCASYEVGASTLPPAGDWDAWFAQAAVLAIGSALDPGSPEHGTITGLQAGTAYYVAVRARNSDGLFSDCEPAVVQSTTGGHAPPPAPIAPPPPPAAAGGNDACLGSASGGASTVATLVLFGISAWRRGRRRR